MIKKIIDSDIFRFVIALAFLAICGVAGATLSYIHHESNPTDEAVEYFKAFMSEDYDTLYGLVEQKDGAYISKNAYTDRLKQTKSAIVIDSYEITDPYIKDGQQMIDIICNNDTTNTSQTIKLAFVEDRKKNKIIPTYKVDVSKMLVKDVKFYVPQGDTFILDGETITNKDAAITTKDKYDVYTFNSMIYGSYKSNSVNKYSQIDMAPEIMYEGSEFVFDTASYRANDTYEANIKNNADNMIAQFYTNVRERKGNNKKLKAYIGEDKKLNKKVEKALNESYEVVYWPETRNIDNYSVLSFSMGEITHTSVYNNDGSFTVKYHFIYTYVSSTDTALYTSYVYNIGGSCETTMTLTYKANDDGTVALTNMSVKNKNKKEKGED